MELFEVNDNSDLRDYIKYASKHVNNLIGVSLPLKNKRKIQEIAVKHLKLKDVNQLRDKYDGQSYLDKLQIKIASLYVIEKEFGIELINFDFIENNKNFDFTLISIDNEKYRVIPFFFGTLPIFDITIKDKVILCAIRSDFTRGVYCGNLDLNKHAEDSFLNSNRVFNENYKKFIGFENINI